MNILLFTEMEKVDGQGRFMLMLARSLLSLGHHVIVASPISPLLTEIDGREIPHIEIGSVRQVAPLQYEELVSDTARLVRAVETHSIDAVFATAKFPFMMANAALGEKYPVFVPILSDTYFVPHTRENQAALQKAAHEGRVIAYSFDTARVHASAFGFDWRSVRYSAFPIDERTSLPQRSPAAVRAELGIQPDELMLLTVGRLDIDKAPAIPPLSFAADTASRRVDRRIRLVVVGDGTLASETRSKSHPNTLFLGSRYDLADLYHACDIYAGEATTILEAAMAGKPVIVTCASSHPSTPNVSRGLYGFHILDYAFLEWTNFVPPTSFEEALFYLAQDQGLRERLGEVAKTTASRRNGIEALIPWLIDVFSGKPVPNRLFGEQASVRIVVAGGIEDGLDMLGEICAKFGDLLRLGVSVENPVPWGRTLAMPPENVQAIVLATRRWMDESTPIARYSDGRLDCKHDVPREIIEVFDAFADRIPPTSSSPPITFSGATHVHAVLSTTLTSAVELLRNANLREDEIGIVWIPTLTRSPDAQSAMNDLQRSTRGGVALIGEPLAWTVIGRFLNAIDSYVDDGSSRFEYHRRYVLERGIIPFEPPKSS